MMAMLTKIALLLRRTAESIKMPCSVKARGDLRTPPQLDVPKWNFKFLTSCCSSGSHQRWTDSIRLKRASTRMIAMLTCTALLLRRSLESIATPYSVKTVTRFEKLRNRKIRLSIRPARTRGFIALHPTAASIFYSLSPWPRIRSPKGFLWPAPVPNE